MLKKRTLPLRLNLFISSIPGPMRYHRVDPTRNQYTVQKLQINIGLELVFSILYYVVFVWTFIKRFSIKAQSCKSCTIRAGTCCICSHWYCPALTTNCVESTQHVLCYKCSLARYAKRSYQSWIVHGYG